MSKALLKKIKDGIVVFDIDGVLAAYEFGECSHYAPIWEEAFISETDNPYMDIEPLPVFQRFIKAMDPKNVFVCSVAENFEKAAKADFVLRNYAIPKENIIFVGEKSKKLAALQALQEKFPDKQIAIVDDTVKTLDAIYSASDFITVHVSSFFDISSEV